MFPCPACGKTLPPSATKCQFCGVPVGHMPRQRDPSDITGSGVRKETVWALYYVFASIWLLTAGWDFLQILVLTPAQLGKDYEGIGAIEIVSMVFTGAQALIAIGLLAKIEIARAIVNFIAFMNLLSGFFGLIGSLLGMIIFGPLAALFIVMNLVKIAINGGIMWVIGETDRRSMN